MYKEQLQEKISPGDPPLFPELDGRGFLQRGVSTDLRESQVETRDTAQMLCRMPLSEDDGRVALQAVRASFGASKTTQCKHNELKPQRSGPQVLWRLRRRWDGSKSKPEGLEENPMTTEIPAHPVAQRSFGLVFGGRGTLDFKPRCRTVVDQEVGMGDTPVTNFRSKQANCL